MIKKHFKVKILSLITAICVIFASAPFSIGAAEATEPAPGSAENAAEHMTVINNGTNKTEEYKVNKTVTVAANTRGSFDSLYFTRPADTAVYYYSANMNILNDTSNYGSVRFVLGYGNIGDVKKYIEVCYRPGINQIVAFLNGNGETPLYVGGGYNFAYAQEYRCTAVYDCGKISFWVNGILVIDNVSLPEELTDIVLEPGFYSQNCDGTIKNIYIWGDTESTKCPTLGENENIIKDVVIHNLATYTYKTAPDGILNFNGTKINRTDFCGLKYSGGYYINAEARFYDNTYKNGENEVDWEGIIFKVATARDANGEEYNIEIRVRRNMTALFAVNNSGEKVITVKCGFNIKFGENHSYTAAYHSDGKLSFWADGVNQLYRYDISEQGYSVIGPAVSLGGEVCSYYFDNIKLWGDIAAEPSDELRALAKAYEAEYTYQYSEYVSQIPAGNVNYISGAQMRSLSGSAKFSENRLEIGKSSEEVNFYLDRALFGKLKRELGEENSGKLKTALENPEYLSALDYAREKVCSFDYSLSGNGEIKLYFGVAADSKKPLYITLAKNGISASAGGKNYSAEYPNGFDFGMSHSFAIRMSADRAVVFLDGAAVLKFTYSPLLPMFSIKTDGLTTVLENILFYLTESGTDTEPKAAFENGDVNTDDFTDIRDLVRLKKILAETAEKNTQADVNGDSLTDANDLTVLKKSLLNGGMGLAGSPKAFHDQSAEYMSDIQPAIDEDVDLKIRVLKNTVTSAIIEYSVDGIVWKTTNMKFEGNDASGEYQYYTGTVPAQKSGFYYRFKAFNDITNEATSGSNKTYTSDMSLKDGWYCMAGQKTPDWSKGALWYSLVPDAFYNGDLTNDHTGTGWNSVNSWNNAHFGLSDRYGGDLAGVLKKLDYINELGADAVYMNPISKSYQNCGYGTTDYNQIEPTFGNGELLKKLTAAAHNKNMKLMTDVVLYFSPETSIYNNSSGINPFLGALQSKESEYLSFFNFKNWPEYEGTEWGGLYTNLFDSSLRKLLYKTQNSALQRLIREYGVDGLRFDCGGWLGSKTDFEKHNSLIKDIRADLKDSSQNMLILSENDIGGMTGYGWDSQWNLDLRVALNAYATGVQPELSGYNTSASGLRDVLVRSLNYFPRQQALTFYNMISFHDGDRIDTKSASGRAATLVQMTYIGSPSVYYGQETGLNRSSDGSLGQSGHAGTSFYAMDWNEQNIDREMLDFYKTLGELRKNYESLKTGAAEFIDCSNSSDLLAFARYNKDETVITLAARNNEINDYEIETARFGVKNGEYFTDYFSGEIYPVQNGKIKVNVPAGGTLLVRGAAKGEYGKKESVIYGSADATLKTYGSGSYKFTAGDSSDESKPFYGAIVNGNDLYVIARRKAGEPIIKQVQTNLPNGAEIRITRDENNIFAVNIVQNGSESLVYGSAAEIETERTLGIFAEALGGNISIESISVVNNNAARLYDDFDSVTHSACWDGFESGGATATNGVLKLESCAVSRSALADDWSAETAVISGSGGIKAFSEDGNYIALTLGERLTLSVNLGGNVIVVAEAAISGGVNHLQLARVGTEYTAYYSDGENKYILGKPIFFNPSAVKIALFTEASAEFDYFLFGNGSSGCTPFVFSAENISVGADGTEPAYEIKSGDWEYSNEGIAVLSASKALMSVTNKVFTNFRVNVTLAEESDAARAGLVFGMNTADDTGSGYQLYKKQGSFILKKNDKTLKRGTASDDRLAISLKDKLLNVYCGTEAKLIFSITLDDYAGGYVGFFSEQGTVTFANYAIYALPDGWRALKGTADFNGNGLKLTSYEAYAYASYVGYALADGSISLSLKSVKRDSESANYCGGLVLGAAFGKSPDTGIFIGTENGAAVVKCKGTVLYSCSSANDAMQIAVSSYGGHFSVNFDTENSFEFDASDCSGGCLSVYGENSVTSFYNIINNK